MCISCRPHVVVHKGELGPAHVDACGQGEGVKNLIFCGCHNWMAPCTKLDDRNRKSVFATQLGLCEYS